jgi:hypothetical protein
MSNGEGPPPIFEGDYFLFWKIRMEAYPEAIDVDVLEPPPKGFLKSRIPLTPLVTRRNTTGGMQRPKIHSTRVLARISLIMCVMQKTLINCGKTFVLSMRELRVSMRNAIILL